MRQRNRVPKNQSQGLQAVELPIVVYVCETAHSQSIAHSVSMATCVDWCIVDNEWR